MGKASRCNYAARTRVQPRRTTLTPRVEHDTPSPGGPRPWILSQGLAGLMASPSSPRFTDTSRREARCASVMRARGHATRRVWPRPPTTRHAGVGAEDWRGAGPGEPARHGRRSRSTSAPASCPRPNGPSWVRGVCSNGTEEEGSSPAVAQVGPGLLALTTPHA